MTTFCHICGTKAIDDKSLFCNECGTQLIPYTQKKNEDCPNCGAQILDKDSVFCLQCGSPISSNNSEVTTVSPSTGVKTYAREAKQSKSQKPFKRKSILLPALLFIIAFAFVLLMISQMGVLDPLSSLRSLTSSQEHLVVPANGTPIPTPSVSIVEPATQTTMMNAIVTSSPIPPESTVVPSTQTTQTPTLFPSGTTVTPATQSTIKNIVATAEADGRFTTFVAALKAADLNDTLSGDTLSGIELFTVFAPTDDAFKNLSGSIDTLLKDPQGDLLQILLYHIVSGKVTAADLKKLTSVETLQGGTLPISVSNGTITVDGATVIITDIECTNGVIHVVDTVMLPPA